jgi:hypothetical protein
MKTFLKKLPHYGDIVASPFFFLVFLYFFRMPNKGPIEYVILTFNLGALLADILFTYLYFTKA